MFAVSRHRRSFDIRFRPEIKHGRGKAARDVTLRRFSGDRRHRLFFLYGRIPRPASRAKPVKGLESPASSRHLGTGQLQTCRG
jgi:hypothetical protein